VTAQCGEVTGPIYVTEAFDLGFTLHVSIYAACYLIAKLGRAELVLPHSSQFLFTIPELPFHDDVAERETTSTGYRVPPAENPDGPLPSGERRILTALAPVPTRQSHSDAEEPLLAWYREVEKEDWDTPVKVYAKYGNASILGDNRVVFNIKGNDYRLVVKINYPYRVAYVRFVGTHAEYDAINVEEV
jgi:mRNA interferase HigB